MVKDRFNGVVGRVVELVNATSRGLNEDVFVHLTIRAQDQDPSVDASLSILVARLVILLIVVDGDLSKFLHLAVGSRLICLLAIPDGAVGLLGIDGEASSRGLSLDLLLLNHLLLVSIVVMIFMLLQIVEISRERAHHVALILRGNLLRRSAIYDISVVTDANEKRGKHNGEVKAIASLPFVKSVCWGGNHLGQLVGLRELLVLEIVSNELGTVLVVIELREGQLGWPDRRADELFLTAFIRRCQQEFACGIIDDLKLALIGRYMLQNELFLRGVLGVAARDIIVALKIDSLLES